MNISITEERLLKVAVSYLGSMYGDLEMSETKNLSIKYFLKENKIIFSDSNNSDNVIVDSQVAEQLESMFGINFPYIKYVTLRWLSEYYGIIPIKFYFGNFNNLYINDEG
jgi:transposase-like protein